MNPTRHHLLHPYSHLHLPNRYKIVLPRQKEVSGVCRTYGCLSGADLNVGGDPKDGREFMNVASISIIGIIISIPPASNTFFLTPYNQRTRVEMGKVHPTQFVHTSALHSRTILSMNFAIIQAVGRHLSVITATLPHH